MIKTLLLNRDKEFYGYLFDEKMSDINNKKGLITSLLINPPLRPVRHLLLILALSIISFNQAFFTFSKYSELSPIQLYGIGFSTLLLYLILVYTNIYVLVPRFLLQRRYTYYILLLSGSLFLFLSLQLLKEYGITEYLHVSPLRKSYLNMVTLLDILSNFFLNMVAITGISLTVLMKHWLTDGSRVSLLEKQQVQQQVEDLKEQVHPELLFKILNRSAALSKFEPEKATEMLYKLSEILRYQLYDCAREKVLLTSVIRFLENYLALEQLYSGSFTYQLTAKGQTGGIFVEPFLYIPFIREMVARIYQTQEKSELKISFTIEDNTILFICQAKDIPAPDKKSLSGIIHRLDVLYKNEYSLQIDEDKEEKKVTIRFELKQK